MICKKPYTAGTLAFGCGQCMPCRINRRRLWQWRMVLESLCHEENCFVTLTYDPRPYANHLRESLRIGDYQRFLKRLRTLVYPRKLRFYCVGEYGEKSQQAHFHLMFFGLGLNDAHAFQKSWPFGIVHVDECNPETCQYIAGYVTKKMTSKFDARLNGRFPEFSRQSLKPGIGAPAAKIIAQSLLTEHGQRELERLGDVPHALKMGRRSVPLHRYLRQLARNQAGVTEEARKLALEKWSLQASREVLDLQIAALALEKTWKTTKEVIAVRDVQKIRNIEGRSKLTRGREL